MKSILSSLPLFSIFLFSKFPNCITMSKDTIVVSSWWIIVSYKKIQESVWYFHSTNSSGWGRRLFEWEKQVDEFLLQKIQSTSKWIKTFEDSWFWKGNQDGSHNVKSVLLLDAGKWTWTNQKWSIQTGVGGICSTSIFFMIKR